MQTLKNFKYFAMMLLMAMACVSLTACGGDDDDDPIVNPDTPSDPSGGGSEGPSQKLDKVLVGQWIQQTSSSTDDQKILFNSNGTGKWWTFYKGELQDEWVTTWETPSEGILIVKYENVLTWETFTEKMQYAVRNDVLKLTYYDEDGTTLTAITEVYKRVW